MGYLGNEIGEISSGESYEYNVDKMFDVRFEELSEKLRQYSNLDAYSSGISVEKSDSQIVVSTPSGYIHIEDYGAKDTISIIDKRDKENWHHFKLSDGALKDVKYIDQSYNNKDVIYKAFKTGDFNKRWNDQFKPVIEKVIGELDQYIKKGKIAELKNDIITTQFT